MKDKLIIIGNGFDIWQGLHTSYGCYRDYFYTHKDEILKELNVKEIEVGGDDGVIKMSPLEFIYNDELEEDKLDDGFWNYFESNLAYFSNYKLIQAYDDPKEDVEYLGKLLDNAYKVLCLSFNKFFKQVSIEDKDSGYCFGEDCYCINFNYTGTLKRFNNPSTYHIHGSIKDNNLVFGHNIHPRPPFKWFKRQDDFRYKQLYLLEEFMYKTDKHIFDNICNLRINLLNNNINLNDIKDVYVLGFSFNEVDFDYIKYLIKGETIEHIDFESDMRLTLNYCVNEYGYSYDWGNYSIYKDEEELSFKRDLELYYIEKQKVLYRKYPRLRNIKDTLKNANWHVHYHTNSDKQRVEEVFTKLEFTNYDLFNSINECIKGFKR